MELNNDEKEKTWIRTMGYINCGDAKAGIDGLSRSVAVELGRYSVACNVFTPMAATQMTTNEEVKKGLKKRFQAGNLTKE